MVVGGRATVLPGGRSGGKGENWGGQCPVSKVSDSSMVVPRLSEGQREKMRGETAVPALYGHHLVVPDEEVATEWQEWLMPWIMRGLHGPHVHQWQTAAITTLNICNPGDGYSRVSFSSACN